MGLAWLKFAVAVLKWCDFIMYKKSAVPKIMSKIKLRTRILEMTVYGRPIVILFVHVYCVPNAVEHATSS